MRLSFLQPTTHHLPTAFLGALMLLCAAAAPVRAQDVSLWNGALRWRIIGPFRGGRTVAAVGVPQQPSIFYIGVNNGGVWKTNDYGRTWKPIFDGQSHRLDRRDRRRAERPQRHLRRQRRRPPAARPLRRRRDLQVHRRRPHLDAPRPRRRRSRSRRSSWTRATPNKVLVAVLGHPYGPNETRGVFRSTDGGATWTKVLYKDENTGAVDLVVRSGERRHRLRRAVGGAAVAVGEAARTTLNLRRTTASTARPTAARPGSRSAPACPTATRRPRPHRPRHERRASRGGCTPSRRRTKNGGLYRSDDGGATWRLVNADHRLWDRDGDFSEVKVDPKNADVVYVVERLVVEEHRRRRALHRLQGRARRRRPAPAVDQSGRSADDDPRGRPGRGRQRQRRRDLVELVQPADGAVLPRHHRQRLPLPRLRRAAGERLGVGARAAGTTGRSPSPTGIRWAPRSTATSRPTRCTRT